MATKNRPTFLRQAVNYFLAQTIHELEPCELTIVDDSGSESFTPVLEHHVHHVRVYRRIPPWTQGEKINYAIARSSGAIIVKLDDDDYYSPDFVLTLVNNVRQHGGSTVSAWCCASACLLLDDPDKLYFSGHGWRFGSTFGFQRSLWEMCPFPPVNGNVDGRFVTTSQSKVHRICSPYAYMIVRHGGNTWKETLGTPVEDYFKQYCQPSQFSLEDIVGPSHAAFYRILSHTYARH